MEEFDEFERTVSAFDGEIPKRTDTSMDKQQVIEEVKEEDDDFERTVSAFDTPLPQRSTPKTSTVNSSRNTNGMKANSTVSQTKSGSSTTKMVLLILAIVACVLIGFCCFILYFCGPLIILGLFIQLICVAGLILSIIGLVKK